MISRIAFFVLLLTLIVVVSPAWAVTQNCTPAATNPCSVTFSPGQQGVSTGIFDFSSTGDGIITFQFDTVLTTFTLTVTASEVSSVQVDPNSDVSTASCVNYTKGPCVRYDVAGTAGAGLGGLPLRGTDYKGLITVLLNYNAFFLFDKPIFGHAPGDTNQIFSEDILTSYVDENALSCTNCEDPAMGGKTPGLSSFAALHEPFPSGQSLTVCNVTATSQNSTSGNNPIVEVSFKLVAANGDCNIGPYLRDKTASLTVGSMDIHGNIIFTNLVNNGDANKFHYDNKNNVNIQDINTNGLTSGVKYFVTVISDLFSPVTTTFIK